MLKNLKSLFAEHIAMDAQTEQKDANRKLAVATGALLLEMANADSDFSELENKNIIDILQKDFALSADEVEPLLQISEQERKESVDLWQFTNLINTNYDNAQKARVVETLWRVIYADGKVDMYEEALMRKLNLLLKMDHSVMIAAKLKVRAEFQSRNEK